MSARKTDNDRGKCRKRQKQRQRRGEEGKEEE
jgi:hypothetical protein